MAARQGVTSLSDSPLPDTQGYQPYVQGQAQATSDYVQAPDRAAGLGYAQADAAQPFGGTVLIGQTSHAPLGGTIVMDRLVSTPIGEAPAGAGAAGLAAFAAAHDDGPGTVVISEGTDTGTVFLADPVVAAPQLRITRVATGEVYTPQFFPAILGKGTAANIVVAGNEAISRTHVSIDRAGTEFTVTNLGSTNKTQVGDIILAPGESSPLRDGSTFVLANETFEVSIG